MGPTDETQNSEKGKIVFGSKIRLDKNLLAKAKEFSKREGYSSVEEFVAHAVEKEVSKLEAAADEEEIQKRLRGLGYIS